MTSRRVVFLSALLLPLVAAGSVQAEQRVSSERFLPRRTVAFVKVPNAAEFRRRWDRSSFGAIQRDPAFAPFFADLERQLDERTARMRRATGAGVKDLWLSLQGEIAVAVVNSTDGFAVVGVAEVGKDEPSAARAVSLLETSLAAHGAVGVHLKAGRVDVMSWGIGDDGDKITLAYFRRGRHIVAGFDLNSVLTLAANSDASEAETLAGNPVYQYVMEQTSALSGEPAVQWFVDPVGGLEAAIDSNLQDNPNRGLITGLLRKAGVDKVKGIGGSIELASPFADNIMRTFGYVEPPVDGLLDAFRLPATRQVPPSWVPDDVNFYMQVNWSGPRFYHAVSDFFDSFQGGGAFRSLVGSGRLPNSQSTFEDCMNQLVGPVHFAASFPRSTGDLAQQPAVVAIGVADPKKAREMLRSIAESAGGKIQSIGGEPTYTIRLGFPGGAGGIEVGASIADGSLMLSTNTQYLASILAPRVERRPLAHSPAFRQAMSNLPDKTSMLSYQHQDRRFEGLYEAIRGGQFRLPVYGGLVTGLGLDFSKLPPAHAIRNYLQNSSSFIEPADKGFRMIEIGYRPTPAPVRPRSYE